MMAEVDPEGARDGGDDPLQLFKNMQCEHHRKNKDHIHRLHHEADCARPSPAPPCITWLVERHLQNHMPGVGVWLYKTLRDI